MTTEAGDPGTVHAEPESGAAVAATANEGSAPADRETAGDASGAGGLSFEDMKALYLKQKSELEEFRNLVPELLRTMQTESSEDDDGPEPPTSAGDPIATDEEYAVYLQKVRAQAKLPGDHGVVARSVLREISDRANVALRMELNSYPDEDKPYLERLVRDGRARNVADASILLDGAKARRARAMEQKRLEELKKREDVQSQLEDRRARGVVNTSVSPVGAGELQRRSTITMSQFSKRLSGLREGSPEHLKFIEDTDAGGPIEVVPD